jgi:hypothetical protein
VDDARRSQAIALLTELGAGEIEHVEGDLLTHLEGTDAILRGWGASDEVALAGLCHAAYGTAGFDVALLELSERSRLADVIGVEAETHVYRYASCDRRAVYPNLDATVVEFVDRYTHTAYAIDPEDLRAFALVTAANELELAGRHLFDATTNAEIADLVDALAMHVPELAGVADGLRSPAS